MCVEAAYPLPQCIPLQASHSHLADYCLSFAQAPPKESKVLFLQYAALEENYGLARSAMEVYDKAIQTVPQNERLSVYDLYLARASDFFGIAKVDSLCFLPPSLLSFDTLCQLLKACENP